MDINLAQFGFAAIVTGILLKYVLSDRAKKDEKILDLLECIVEALDIKVKK